MSSDRATLGIQSTGRAVKVPAPFVPDEPGQISYSRWPSSTRRLSDIVRHGMPRPGLPAEVNRWRLRNQRHLWRGLSRLLFARALRQHRIYGALFVDVLRADGSHVGYGLASLELVTTVGCDYIANVWGAASSFPLTSIKYHGIGTSGTTAVIGDTALGAEITGTQLSVTNTRGTGTLSASSHNVVQSLGTVTLSSGATGTPIAVVEAGLFSYPTTTDTPSQATGKILFDHFVFAAINLSPNDGITSTVQVTLPPGS